jgi:pyrimidine deaminase RibD-like protein
MSNNEAELAGRERAFMSLAIEEARKCRPPKPTNPYVGAVAVDESGNLLAVAHRGEYPEADGDHGEYNLLEKKLRTQALAGATVYTTLEPCIRRGRTKEGEDKIPCAERLIGRKVKRVVVGMLDPNPDITGKGIRMLLDAGVQVTYFDKDYWAQVEELNHNFTRSFKKSERRLTAPESPDHLAVRSYLQRGEVRLSTMHRIAGAFLSGAGILILLPVLFRDSLSTIVGTLSKFAAGAEWWEVSLYYVLPCVLVFGIPLWSLWLLLKDLTNFYFTANIPPGKKPPLLAGTRPTSNTSFQPRFALTAIPFSNDEAPGIKSEMRKHQFNTPLMYFLLSPNEREQQWLLDIYEVNKDNDTVLPKDEWLANCSEDSSANALRMAFGLAGAYNRDLIEEAAKMELSLVRHNLHLRRLLMRYMKALLIIIWTATISFVMASIIGHVQVDWQLVALLVGLWLWAGVVQLIVRSPLKWIRSEYDKSKDDRSRDEHLLFFEQTVILACLVVTVGTAAVLANMLNGRLFNGKPSSLITLSIFVIPLASVILLVRGWARIDFSFLKRKLSTFLR